MTNRNNQNPDSPITSLAELKKEFRNKLYTAIASGIVAGLVTATVAGWAVAKRLPLQLGLVPPGTVAAFDLDACPVGWSDYGAASGRFVLGANPELRWSLSKRVLHEPGGAEFQRTVSAPTRSVRPSMASSRPEQT